MYHDTKSPHILCREMYLYADPDHMMTTWTAKSEKLETVLMANFNGYWDDVRNENGLRYFIIDREDEQRMQRFWKTCNSHEDKAKVTKKILSSVTGFSQTMKFKKRIYIRSIPSAKLLANLQDRIFTDEIIEIIPIILQQQGTPIPDDHELLAKYRDLWMTGDFHFYNTITPKELNKVLREFDINKELITIVQDPVHNLAMDEVMLHGGYIKIFSPDCNVVVDASQAVLYLFMATVAGVNWVSEKCPMHEDCRENLRGKILEVMNELAGVKEGNFISLRLVMSKIVSIKRECDYNYNTQRGSTDIFLRHYEADDVVPVAKYNTTTQFFDLPVYENFFKNMDKAEFKIDPKCETLPIWMARVFVLFGWSQVFFNSAETTELRDLICNCLLYLVPRDRTSLTETFFISIIQKQTPFCFKYGTRKVQKNEDAQVLKMKEAAAKRAAELQEKKKAKKEDKKKGK